MGVLVIGIEWLFYVVNYQFAVETLQIVGIKETFRFLPVSFAVSNLLGVSVVVVGHVVKVYVDGVSS